MDDQQAEALGSSAISESLKMNSVLAAKDYPTYMLAHRWLGDLPMPNIKLLSQSAIDRPDRVQICERLLQSYNLAIQDEKRNPLKREGEDLWSPILRKEFPTILASIENGDARQLSKELMIFGSSPVWFGGLTTGLDGFNWNNWDLHWIALTYYDKLLSIAEYMGIIPAPMNEAGNGARNFSGDINELVCNIEKELGFSILPPPAIVPVVGISANHGIFNYRHLLGLYGALRVSDLAIESHPIAEFGGGLGITALYARRMGFNDYTLLDLPMSCLFAGHFLINSLGENHVSLYGEKLSDHTIKILPYWECQNLQSKRYCLSLNQDSMPEMADNFIHEYLRQIRRITDGVFLSINHEGFFPRTVNKFILASGGFKRINRSKCFVREGYIEEAYRIM
jgi:hypothetical protein